MVVLAALRLAAKLRPSLVTVAVGVGTVTVAAAAAVPRTRTVLFSMEAYWFRLLHAYSSSRSAAVPIGPAVVRLPA